MPVDRKRGDTQVLTKLDPSSWTEGRVRSYLEKGWSSYGF